MRSVYKFPIEGHFNLLYVLLPPLNYRNDAILTGLEPATLALTRRCANQLRHRTKMVHSTKNFTKPTDQVRVSTTRTSLV